MRTLRALSIVTFTGVATACGGTTVAREDGSGGAGSATSSATTGAGGESSSATGTAASATSTSGATTTTTTTGATTTSSGAGGGTSTTGCVTATAPGHHVMPCDGFLTYDVEIPAACPPEGCGLILDMHGFTMNAGSEDANTDARKAGAAQGFVVVQPTAPGAAPSWDQATHVPPVFDFVADVAQLLGTDPKRAHVMGFSQGGGMTWAMVCAHADFFASAAPIGALAGCAFGAGGMPSEEVDMLVMHGTADAVVSFTQIAIPQRDLAIAGWSLGAPSVIDSDGSFTATRWTSASGTTFEFWDHAYASQSFLLGGHCFPGSSDTGFLGFACVAPSAFTYGALALQFFADHPKD